MPAIDERQFLSLYDQYVGKIYRYIFFRVGSEEQAQDLTSEVFLKSWQYVQQKGDKAGKELANPRAFFYQITRNMIADFYRQKDRTPLSLEEIADKIIADKSEGIAEKTAGVNLEMEAVKKALAKLKGDYQEVIIWRYLDELDIKEIASILEKTEGAVRVLLSRALNDLKDALK